MARHRRRGSGAVLRRRCLTALAIRVPPVQALVLGAITGIGGGMLRDILVNEIPGVLRGGLYAVPALLGAAIVVTAYEAGSRSAGFPLLGMLACFAVRLVALRRNIDPPRDGRVTVTYAPASTRASGTRWRFLFGQ